MSYRRGERLLWLPDILRDAGVQVVEVAGWKSRGGLEDASRQELDIQAVLWHATAEAANGSAAGGLGGVVYGTPSAPPPVSQTYVGRDARWYIVASGVANHMGSGNLRVAGKAHVHGNAKAIGMEAANNNRGELWRPAQYTSMVIGAAAITRYVGLRAADNLAHRETSTTGKTDPVGINMATTRTAVGKLLGGGGGGSTPPVSSWPKTPMTVGYMSTVWANNAFSTDIRQVPYPQMPQLCLGTGGPTRPTERQAQAEQIRAAVRWFQQCARVLFKTQMIPAAEYNARQVGPGTLAFAKLIHQMTGTTWRGCITPDTWFILGHRKAKW